MFQIIYKVIHYNRKKTPLFIGYAQTIHDVCRSKHLIELSCRLESYDEIERIDMEMVQRTIDLTGKYRVPVPPAIKPTTSGFNTATDNFDKNNM